uniref:Uncharacterized protein n=1 Tax=Aegilops tauschii TaxID=37682 RepID=R7WAW2_AEGTA
MPMSTEKPSVRTAWAMDAESAAMKGWRRLNMVQPPGGGSAHPHGHRVATPPGA